MNELERRFSEYKNMLLEQQELSKELVSANEKLVESEALKTHFISSITNEIINPFASILGLSRNLLMMKSLVPEKVYNMIRLIYDEAFSLDFQLKNIFASAKIEAGELYIEASKVNIVEIINNIMDSFRHEADSRNVSLVLAKGLPDSFFYIDEEKIKLIISNLISNAVKYTENGRVSVNMEKCGEGIMVAVRDDGIGIEEDNKELIFDRFKRVDDRINSLNRGHGLGLAIVRSLTELLDGNISLTSHIGQGSEFRLYIPEAADATSIYDLFGEEGSEISSRNEVF